MKVMSILEATSTPARYPLIEAGSTRNAAKAGFTCPPCHQQTLPWGPSGEVKLVWPILVLQLLVSC